MHLQVYFSEPTHLYVVLASLVETAKSIHKLLGGQQISFPKKLYCSDYVNSCIQGSYNGRNIRELAQRVGIFERRVRQILHKPK